MKILIAGDFCPKHRVADLLDRGEFDKVLGDVIQIIGQSDYSMVNFECPVCQGDEKPIEKLGPNLKCSEKGIAAINWAGFNCVTLANNHFLDYGKEGVEHTLKACEKYSIDTVGGGLNLNEASKILYKEIDGKTLAIINCCEHEFSIATDETAGSNPLNPIQQYYAIKEAKTKADYVLVIVHGGHEHYQLPSPRMQETYRFFIDAGSDGVVNHHQHCYSGFEVYKGKPIIYGLGNFLFDNPNKRNGIWNDGYMVVISFGDPKSPSFKIIPYTQCNEEPKVTLIENEKEFFKNINSLNSTISDDYKLKAAHEEMKRKYAKGYQCLLQPYSFRIDKGLYNRGYLPSLVSQKKKYQILNYLQCEAHLERFIYAVKNL